MIKDNQKYFNRLHVVIDALAIVTVMDTKDGLKRLAQALKIIDGELQSQTRLAQTLVASALTTPRKTALSIYQADIQEKQQVRIEESIDCISGEFVYVYPPGIPILVPGEIVTENIRNQILTYKKQGLSVQGLADLKAEKITIII